MKKKEFEAGPKASYGYGGQFGVQKDRMDKVRTGVGYCNNTSCVATSYFFEVLYFFFTISRFCTFFVLFSGLVLFWYFFFINLPEFYQIL